MAFHDTGGSYYDDGGLPSERMGRHERVLSFVDLVFTSQSIVVGEVTRVSPASENDVQLASMSVRRSFRKQMPSQVTITLLKGNLGQDVNLDQGSSYVLFLTDVHNGEAMLAGSGDMGVWPRRKSDWKYSTGHVQPLEDLVSVIEAILEVDALESYQERATALDKLSQRNELGRIAALQYVAEPGYWPDKADGDHDVSSATVESFIALSNLLGKRSTEYTVEAKLMQVLNSTPKLIALSAWIDGLRNAEVSVRDDALAALTAEADEDFGFDARTEESERASTVKRWQDWLAQQRPSLMRQEIPPLINRLHHDLVLERTVANLALRAVSATDVGFVADGSEAARQEAASKWEQWWRDTEADLSR